MVNVSVRLQKELHQRVYVISDSDILSEILDSLVEQNKCTTGGAYVRGILLKHNRLIAWILFY